MLAVALCFGDTEVPLQLLCHIYPILIEKCSKNIAKNSEEEVLEILYKRMTFSQIPEKYFELKKKYSTRIGHPIINLFDCISEIDYTKYIFDFPKNGNF